MKTKFFISTDRSDAQTVWLEIRAGKTSQLTLWHDARNNTGSASLHVRDYDGERSFALEDDGWTVLYEY